MNCKLDKPLITLKLSGQEIAVPDDGKTKVVFDWCNALIDSLIIVAITAGVGLTAIGADGGITVQEATNLIGGILVEFFGLLATKRGLREKRE